jgi:L-ascorbate metabolism protein UlaG (beta-lactamase superfamily)
MPSAWLLGFAAALLVAFPPHLARAQGSSDPSAQPQLHCPGVVAQSEPHLVRAAFADARGREGEVRLTYVGHSTFLIESPRGVRIATDYNDYVRPSVTPDIATMNHAHSTHYSDAPDPNIKLVLRGWGDDGAPAVHDLSYDDVRVRNVPTNIRSGAIATERYGNSIFVFETAQLCIGHLGHLHHLLTPQQLRDVGHLHVVLAPVDGTYTLDLDGVVEVLRSLAPELIIPMHYFSRPTLTRFLGRVGTEWEVQETETASTVISRAQLPNKTKVLVLAGH